MAKAVATIQREKTLSTLAKRLFVIDGPNSAKDVERASRALLRENPKLADREAFRSGVSVIVPSDIGLAATDRVKQPTASLEGMLEEAGRRLQIADVAMHEGFARSNQEAEQNLERLQDRALAQAFERQWPESDELMHVATENVRARLGRNEEREAELSAAIESAREEIERLLRLASG